MSHTGGTYLDLCSMKVLGIFLLSPGWDADYSPALNVPVPIYTPGWREAL